MIGWTLCSDCDLPLFLDFTRPGKEWWCAKCGRFTAFFDGHHSRAKELTPEQQEWFDSKGALKQLERYESEGNLSVLGRNQLERLRAKEASR